MPDEKLARALRARIRRRILKTIIDSGELSVTEISKKLGIGKYSASKHLKLLYDLGLVDVKEDPPRKLYRVTVPEIRELLEAYDKVVEAISKR
ncbi:MAG: helix-turn-helix transcriptional regulator [Archaeoglobus sp.]|uniref:helix-turn-helix domain-containing protein n=1 Tax=Archaeoglobus sp. TaxID=1872626 RepID=UPI001D80089E|nr:helix-turn-helix domain-containing protein [Archaeoglobus sp.]MBO8179481.1 helix-turn-helix transcriptional regulator [Archaeoglobus sp.]